jgi:hypothetical protein
VAVIAFIERRFFDEFHIPNQQENERENTINESVHDVIERLDGLPDWQSWNPLGIHKIHFRPYVQPPEPIPIPTRIFYTLPQDNKPKKKLRCEVKSVEKSKHQPISNPNVEAIIERVMRCGHRGFLLRGFNHSFFRFSIECSDPECNSTETFSWEGKELIGNHIWMIAQQRRYEIAEDGTVYIQKSLA